MKSIIIFTILIFTYTSQAQEMSDALQPKKENKLKENKVGLTYSMLSGYGLTYLRSFDNNFSIKTQLYLWGITEANGTEYRDNSLDLAIGAELQYNLAKFQSNRLYALAGFYFDYEYSLYDYLKGSQSNRLVKTAFDITRHFNVGLGVGFEVYLLNNISVAFDGGYYGQVKSNNYADFLTATTNTKAIGFGLAGGISLYYNF